jgi:hypothetical protein
MSAHVFDGACRGGFGRCRGCFADLIVIKKQLWENVCAFLARRSLFFGFELDRICRL